MRVHIAGRWILERFAELDPVEADYITMDRSDDGWSLAA